MANRVIFSPTQFRISKPGFDVLTTGVNNLLLSDASGTRTVYKVLSGSVLLAGPSGGNPATPVHISHPNYGQIPYVYYRASANDSDSSYRYIVYNFEIFNRSLTGFTLQNLNTTTQRVMYYIWIV